METVMKFENNENLQGAIAKLDEIKEWYEPLVKTKIQPKIRVCNVSIEEDKGEAIKTICDKNRWLGTVIEKDDDFKMIAEYKDVRNNNTKHYIIRCTPRIRHEIHKKGDAIFTENSKCNVVDTYHIWQCYKCQGFGHKQSSNGKECEHEQVCSKCAGKHRTDACPSENEVCCVNCQKAGKSDTRHRSSSKNCPKYKEEIERVRKNTDHGY